MQKILENYYICKKLQNCSKAYLIIYKKLFWFPIKFRIFLIFSCFSKPKKGGECQKLITIELFKQSSLIIYTFYDYCKAIAMYNDKFNDCIVSGSIYNEFCTLKTLLTQEISFPLQFFQFLLKITQNYTQFQAHNFHCNSKKNKRPAKFFSSFRLGSFFSRLSRWLVDWSNARLVVRLFSIDCWAIDVWEWGKGGRHLPVAKIVPINKFAPFWKTNRWLIEQPSDPYRLSQRLVAMLAAFVGCLWSWL